MEALRYLGLVLQVGFSIVTPILLCTFVGIKLEAHFNLPFTLIFIILGVAAGFVSGYRLIITWAEKMIDKKEEITTKETDFVSPKRESRVFKKDNE